MCFNFRSIFMCCNLLLCFVFFVGICYFCTVTILVCVNKYILIFFVEQYHIEFRCLIYGKTFIKSSLTTS